MLIPWSSQLKMKIELCTVLNSTIFSIVDENLRGISICLHFDGQGHVVLCTVGSFDTCGLSIDNRYIPWVTRGGQ